MNGNIAIDFRPGAESVPRILQAIGTAGFDLYGLHLTPCCTDRWTLHVDLGGASARAEFDRLERELKSLGDIIEVIHKAPARAAR